MCDERDLWPLVQHITADRRRAKHKDAVLQAEGSRRQLFLRTGKLVKVLGQEKPAQKGWICDSCTRIVDQMLTGTMPEVHVLSSEQMKV